MREDAKRAVAEAGRRLLEEGLVARTWGNVSCRADEDVFVITPSGLAYENMSGDDAALVSLRDGSWTGARKPSSERGIHAAAYAAFPEVGFVIHTHQKYASALSLADFDSLKLDDAQKEKLGGVALARYGLPGTKKLCAAVAEKLKGGAHTVLMAHHGCLIAGADANEAFERARLLEELCMKVCRGQDAGQNTQNEGEALILAEFCARAENAGKTRVLGSVCARAAADTGEDILAQLDDMAQMIGPRLRVIEAGDARMQKALLAQGAVLVPGVGAVCRAETEGELNALCLLTEKACAAYLHTKACGTSARLSKADAYLMRFVYKQKYSKKAEK